MRPLQGGEGVGGGATEPQTGIVYRAGAAFSCPLTFFKEEENWATQESAPALERMTPATESKRKQIMFRNLHVAGAESDRQGSDE